MRNYFRMHNLRIYPIFDFPPPPHTDPNQFYVVFGGSDEQLLFFQNQLEALIGGEFVVSEPQVIWFELDQEFFGNLLACAAGNIWTQTHLNDVFPIDPTLPILYDQTRVEVEGSPRKTWSHGK